MKELAVKAAKDAGAAFKNATNITAKDLKKTKDIFFKTENEIKVSSKSVELSNQGQGVRTGGKKL